MSKIKSVKAFEIYDSRGNPTVYAEVTTEDGKTGCASVPSGASTGSFEAFELRDNDSSRLFGKGVTKAVLNVNTVIRPALSGMSVTEQAVIDKTLIELDGTENKSSLGANAVLAVSLATARAAANSEGLPLYKYLGAPSKLLMPRPMMNIINGGAHATNNIDIQEFMIQPVKPNSFAESMEMCVTVYHTLRKLLNSRNLSTAVGDEGGFAPDLADDKEALKLICEAIEKSGYTYNDIKICLDAATSEWQNESGLYKMPKKCKKYDREEMISMWEELASEFPIVSIEDGLAEGDFEGFAELTKRLGNRLQLVGDDLFVTNDKRLIQGINMKAGNSILIKPNQIGTVTETLNVIKKAHENGYATVISHRSGETEDTFIADLSLAVSSGQIKTGAPCRSERLAKYNRLLLIEESLK